MLGIKVYLYLTDLIRLQQTTNIRKMELGDIIDVEHANEVISVVRLCIQNMSRRQVVIGNPIMLVK